MKKTTLMLCVLLQLGFYKAQDSIQTETNLKYTASTEDISVKTPFLKKEWVKKSIAPTLLFAAAAATWGERENIRETRNRYLPTFKMRYDDYLQYAPAATVYGLNLAGIKGRNNIGRATLSYAASIVIMGIIVNGVKYTAKVERPDESNNKSFPSGHTAMAFTNASFLHKEYGVVNQAYSIGGYSAAAITGLGRNLNNKHWISDVLAGAGIGIISTELGYFFIDKIYKNKGDNLGILSKIEGNGYPSFLSIKIGSALGTTNFLKESELDTRKQRGFEGGLEGAYFFSKKWGVGSEMVFSSFPIKPQQFSDDYENFDITTQSLGFLNFGIGPYFAHDLSDKWQLMLKATGGYFLSASGKVFIKDPSIDLPNNELEIANYKPTKNFRWSSGASITYKFNPELGITAYADYNQARTDIRYRFKELSDENSKEVINEKVQLENFNEKIKYFSLGLKLTAYF